MPHLFRVPEQQRGEAAHPWWRSSRHGWTRRPNPARGSARPGRVLREVEARRRVLARHVLSPVVGDPELPWDDRDDCQFDGDPWPCDDPLDLASPYAGHPGFPR
ncbi:DUF6221 family protein [Streptomyces liangshanensis]|uniref:DUF6221 family protein n=1 Tax=Streptomyces liangshanensis TaxID=2717324 RepID=UPI0036DB0991